MVAEGGVVVHAHQHEVPRDGIPQFGADIERIRGVGIVDGEKTASLGERGKKGAQAFRKFGLVAEGQRILEDGARPAERGRMGGKANEVQPQLTSS